MKLRKRSQENNAPPPGKRKKSKSLRRSERIKAEEIKEKKSEQLAKKELNKGSKKNSKHKNKKEEGAESDHEQITQIVQQSLKETFEKANTMPEKEKELLEEAFVRFECRLCKALFRELAMFLKHKQIFCKELAHDSERGDDSYTPFYERTIYELGYSSESS